jgi:hypothetical protein
MLRRAMRSRRGSTPEPITIRAFVAALLVLCLAGAAVRAEPDPPEPARRSVEFHLDLLHTDGRREEISISTLYHRGERAAPGSVGATFSVAAGWVVLATDDPRALFRTLSVRVLEPAPKVVRATTPVVDHPRLRTIAVRIVDDAGNALPGATLESRPAAPQPPVRTADAAGRVRFDLARGRDAACRAASALSHHGVCVHHPGAHVAGCAWVPVNMNDGACSNTIDADWIARWLAGEAVDLRLPRLPASRQETPRLLRLVDASGAPVVEAYVAAVAPYDVSVWHVVRHLGSATSDWDEFNQGFRRTRADGSLPVSVRERLGVEVRIGETPFAAWVLPLSALPPDGPRALLMPDRCDATIVVEGLPAGAEATWRRAVLPAQRRLLTRLVENVEPEISRSGRPVESTFPALFPEEKAPIGTGGSISVPLAVGMPCRIHVAVGKDVRSLDLLPLARGALRVTKRWGDLRAVSVAEREAEVLPGK